MERDSASPIELPIHPLIDNDLQPLYLVTEPQNQTIINRLANLLGEVAQQLVQAGNTEVASIATEQGYEILRNYDDDAADAIRWCTQPRHTDPSRLGQPRDVDPKLPEPTNDLPFI